MNSDKAIRRIAIVGTGVIGASWAAEFLAHGFDVVATDPAPNAEANLRKYVDSAWPALTAMGLSPKASRERLSFTLDSKAAVSQADLVQENGPERPDFKIKLFADIDAATPPDSIIASSSSGITMSVMQSACKHPERCVIGHPFNPPHMIPLVEVVGGEKTSPDTVQPSHRVLRVDRQKAHPSSQRGGRPRCEPAAGGALSGSSELDSSGRVGRSRRRYGRLLGTRAALGCHGAQHAVPPGWGRMAGFSTSWITSRGPWQVGGRTSAALRSGRKAANKPSLRAS